MDKKKEEFDSNLLDLTRVMRMTAGGRRFRFRAGVVVGDKKGTVGFGVAKGADVAQAIEKATRIAKKNLIKEKIDITSLIGYIAILIIIVSLANIGVRLTGRAVTDTGVVNVTIESRSNINFTTSLDRKSVV